MRCPCKKADLKTLRTLANGRECKRERFCPKCKKKFWTIELFQDDYDTETRDLRHQAWDEESKRQTIENKYERLGELLRLVIKSPGKK